MSRRYGFREYDGPPLEALDLYTDKSGEEIVGQLYNFTDKGGREVALRPEMTPSLARILGERSRSMPKPIRWFSVPQLFRYERQQKGRLREHFQWNVDLVGDDSVAADAEVLAVALDGLRELGLSHEDFRARISDRRLLSAIFRSEGVAGERLGTAFQVVDKVERESPDRIIDRFEGEVGLGGQQARALLTLLREGELDAVAARYGSQEEVGSLLEALRGYLDRLEGLGFGAYARFDLSIVRGLAYYTGIVFELFDRKGEFRAICGGGRYDRLLERVGGEPLPAVGFGMGDVVLGELLAERGLRPEFRRQVDLFIVSVDSEQEPLALRIARALRDRGRSVMYGLKGQSVRKQFSQAGSEGALRTLILGPEEVERGVGRIREMEGGDERDVPLEALLAGDDTPDGR